MSKKSFPVGWTLLGAGLMYIFDPGYGRRRRALMRDKGVRYLNKLSDAADITIHDVVDRSYGLLAETRTRVAGENAPDDSVLAERVRAELGFVVSHPHAIEVMAKEGQVTLSGPILAHEERMLLDRVATVHGVRNIKNRLEVHERPDDVSDLQGDSTRRSRFDLLRSNWSPTTCFVTSVIGGTLASLDSSGAML